MPSNDAHLGPPHGTSRRGIFASNLAWALAMIGVRFSLYPMRDDFVPLILEAVKDLDRLGVTSSRRYEWPLAVPRAVAHMSC